MAIVASILGIGLDIGHVDGPRSERRPCRYRTAVGVDGGLLAEKSRSVASCGADAGDGGIVAVAHGRNARSARKAGRRLRDGVEHGLQLDRRAADDAEHLGCSGLVLSSQLADGSSSRCRVCSSSNRRAFSMAITAWSAKVSRARLHCVNGFTSCAHDSDGADGVAFGRSGTPSTVRFPPWRALGRWYSVTC